MGWCHHSQRRSRPAGILPLRCPRGMVSAASGRYHSRAADLCAGETASWPHVGGCGAVLSVRRSTSHREIFLTLVSPYCPLSRSGLYDMVAARLKSLNVQCAHHGPHSLRHACAARLVAQGLTLKEIGDHLGHRSTSATRVYAKVDLLGLREVAAFDLGELS